MNSTDSRLQWGAARKEFIVVEKDLFIYFERGCTIKEVYNMLISEHKISMSYLTFTLYIRAYGLRKQRPKINNNCRSRHCNVDKKQINPTKEESVSEKKETKEDTERVMPNRWDNKASILENLTINRPTAKDVLG